MNLHKRERIARVIWRLALSDWFVCGLGVLGPVIGILWSLNQ